MGTKTSLKTYIVSWYGPFYSLEEMAEWQNQQDNEFCLYLLQGKKPKAKAYSYYCGQTLRNVPERFRDKDHPINSIPNRQSIWIGTLETPHNSRSINIAENLFISLLYDKSDKQCLNKCKLYFHEQKHNMFFISRWHNPNRNLQPECSIKRLIPDAVAYIASADKIETANSLSSL